MRRIIASYDEGLASREQVVPTGGGIVLRSRRVVNRLRRKFITKDVSVSVWDNPLCDFPRKLEAIS
jgi:hypothetical protein